MRLFFLSLIFFTSATCAAQTLQTVYKETGISLRGLSVVSDSVVWASGSNGTVVRSIDGGQTWKKLPLAGYERMDFRDIEAFDSSTAVILAIAEPAYVLRTSNGGASWQLVYENHTPGVFLDAMDFRNEQEGIIVGDPIDGKFLITRSIDGGISWTDLPPSQRPTADSGEACFASSGTNIRWNGGQAMFVSGGTSTHLFKQDKKIVLPIAQKSPTSGANSMAVNENVILVAGGDFTSPESSEANSCYSLDGGLTWQLPVTPPRGYRSCVEHLRGNQWITCGLNGVDISVDNGRNWNSISTESFHAVRKAKKGNAVFFSGNGGRIAKLIPN